MWLLLGRDRDHAASVPNVMGNKDTRATEPRGAISHCAVCQGYLGIAAAVSKEMFCTSQDANELMPHNVSWRLIRLQL